MIPDPNQLAAQVQAMTVTTLARSLIEGMPVSFSFQLACDLLSNLANRTAKANAPPEVVYALRMARAMVAAAKAEADGAKREADTGLVIAAADSRVNGKLIAGG